MLFSDHRYGRTKKYVLALEGIHTLRNCLMNLRSPPVITSYPGNWPRVIFPSSFITLAQNEHHSGFLVCNVFIPYMGS